MGQGPRPDLLFEEMQEREQREAEMELRKRKQQSNLHQELPPLHQNLSQSSHQNLSQEQGPNSHGDQGQDIGNAPAVWNGEDSFASRVEDIPKPTKKDLLAMIIAMLELMLPIALLFVAIFAGVIFLLQKVWLHG